MNPHPKGVLGEDYAAGILKNLGYEILARNFHSRYGEVDIIAQKDDIIAFVEVKARKSGSMVSGLEAVTRVKQRKIIATAIWFMRTRRCDFQPRFDVFSVVTSGEAVVSHDYVEGAFDSGAYYTKRN